MSLCFNDALLTHLLPMVNQRFQRLTTGNLSVVYVSHMRILIGENNDKFLNFLITISQIEVIVASIIYLQNTSNLNLPCRFGQNEAYIEWRKVIVLLNFLGAFL